MTLGSAHPDDPTVVCEIKKPNHPECTGFHFARDEYVDWPNPDHIPSKAIKENARGRLREMADRAEPAPRAGELTGFPAGEEGSKRAATRWDVDQLALVDKAIRTVAERHRGGGEFTSDEIWAELNGAVPVTKGLTARLMRASRAGLIDTTGKFAVSERGGHHDHGQRLSIWYSLIS